MMTGSIEDILRFYPVFEVDACRLKQRGRGSFLTVKRGSASAVSCNGFGVAAVSSEENSTGFAVDIFRSREMRSKFRSCSLRQHSVQRSSRA